MTDRVEQFLGEARLRLRAPAIAGTQRSRKLLILAILLLALLAFELFNFDTTQYALNALLGDVRFAGVRWATILALAFCGIDFAGLLRVFTPDEQGEGIGADVWYLMAAWLLGATMNALMTWYAVSLTLLQHDIGNELLSRDQLLLIVPPFVALLVWLTRILFIGALSLAGGEMVAAHAQSAERAPAHEYMAPPQRAPEARPAQSAPPQGVPAMLRPAAPGGTRRRAPLLPTTPLPPAPADATTQPAELRVGPSVATGDARAKRPGRSAAQG